MQQLMMVQQQAKMMRMMGGDMGGGAGAGGAITNDAALMNALLQGGHESVEPRRFSSPGCHAGRLASWRRHVLL